MRPQAPSFGSSPLRQSGSVPTYNPNAAPSAPNQQVPPMRPPQASWSGSNPQMAAAQANMIASQPKIGVTSQPNINMSSQPNMAASQPHIPGSGPQMAPGRASGGWTAAKPTKSGLGAYLPWILVGAFVFFLLTVGTVAWIVVRSPRKP
jgi:hypothetical protein